MLIEKNTFWGYISRLGLYHDFNINWKTSSCKVYHVLRLCNNVQCKKLHHVEKSNRKHALRLCNNFHRTFIMTLLYFLENQRPNLLTIHPSASEQDWSSYLQFLLSSAVFSTMTRAIGLSYTHETSYWQLLCMVCSHLSLVGLSTPDRSSSSLLIGKFKTAFCYRLSERNMNKWTRRGNGAIRGRIAWILLQSTSGLVNWMKIPKQPCESGDSSSSRLDFNRLWERKLKYI